MGIEFTFQLSCNLEDIVWTICLWFVSLRFITQNYSSKHYDICKLLEKSDSNIFRKIKNNDIIRLNTCYP